MGGSHDATVCALAADATAPALPAGDGGEPEYRHTLAPKSSGVLTNDCTSGPVRGRPRCRMRGCGGGGAGPTGKRNGNFRHGRDTKEIDANHLPDVRIISNGSRNF